MERRKFLKILGAGSVLAGIGVVSLNSFQSSVKAIIIHDTRGLNIQEGDVDQFLSDARKEKFWQQFDLTKKGFLVAHTWLGSEFLPYRLKYDQYRSLVVSTFLLSTNYFTNKMDTSLPIRYESFYNPYKRACASPFSNFYYPA